MEDIEELKSAHNRAVGEFFKSDLKKCDQFKKSLISLTNQNEIQTFPIVEISSVNLCPLYYNYAVILFHQRHLYSALKIMTGILQHVDHLNNNFLEKVGLLTVCLLLDTNQTKKADLLLEMLQNRLNINNDDILMADDDTLEPEQSKKHEDLDEVQEIYRNLFRLALIRSRLLNGKSVTIPLEDSSNFCILKAHQFFLMNDFQMAAKELSRHKMFRVVILLALATVSFGNPLLHRDERIVGGAPAIDGQFPYQASLRAFPAMNLFCGASIISEFWTLSAAHCTINRTPANTRIVVGTVLINGGANPILREVARIVNHPEYNAALIAQDVCVVRVTTPFVWTANVQPIRVGSEFIGGGVTSIVSGWGGTAVTGGPLPNNLQWLTKQTLTNADCAARMGANAHFVLASKICTFTQAGQGICQGDSGGPLTAGGAVIGIVSWNIPCARGSPDGYDRVSHWYNWINTNAAD